MRFLRPTGHGRHDSASEQRPAAGEGVVRVALPELIGLSRHADRLALPADIRGSLHGGQRLSGHLGRGMEFAETRPYQPGDDVRTLDWRVTARTGKAHTKLFREERERPVLLWVDDRAAMHFATRGVFKSVIAARLAALLAWSALRQGDRVGGQIFGAQRHVELRPQWSRKALLEFLRHLAAPAGDEVVSSGEPVRLEPALARLRRQVRPGSLVFLLSDFRLLDERAAAHLADLARHCRLVMIFIHDPLEIRLPPAGRYRLGDGNREIILDAGDRRIVDGYLQRGEERRAFLEGLARRHGMLWLPCSTSDDPLRVLQRGLGSGPTGRRGGGS